MTSVSVKDIRGGDAETKKEEGHLKTDTQSEISKPHTMPRKASNSQKLEKGMNAFFLRASRGNQLKPWFWLLWENTFHSLENAVVFSTQVGGNLLQLPWETNIVSQLEGAQGKRRCRAVWVHVPLTTDTWDGQIHPIPPYTLRLVWVESQGCLGNNPQGCLGNKFRLLQRNDGTDVQDVLFKVTL